MRRGRWEGGREGGERGLGDGDGEVEVAQDQDRAPLL